MDLAERALDSTNLFNSKCGYLNVSKDDQRFENSETVEFPLADAEKGVVNAIYEDNKAQLVANLERLLSGAPLNIKFFRVECSDEIVKQTVASKLLCLCCEFDSVECASALLNGEICGVVPMVNEYDECGFTALHTAAARHSAKCVGLLLRKRARTDLKTKDGIGVIALELSLSSNRMEVVWNPDDHSVEDLIVCLSEKSLTSVSLLSDATKELGDVAFANALGGRIVPLVALLTVAADKLKEVVLELHDSDLASKEKITIYEGVIKEALSLGRARMLTRAAKRTDTLTEKRRLLICEVKLLHLFGVAAFSGCRDRKVTSPLIHASQVGDLDIIQLSLRMNIDVNDVDAEGNTALHWSVKISKGSCPQQMKILLLLLKNGARVNKRNKLGLTAVHVAAANGNLEALHVLLLEFPDGINCKTEMNETPLFFAAKNDNINCLQLLLQLGACTEVLNLRKRRPIDLAKSEDVRFLLSSSNINLVNHVFPIQQERCANKEFDEVSVTCDRLQTAGNTIAERVSSSSKAEICKYFKSPRGCIRGARCFYAHEKSEHRQLKLQNLLTQSIASKGLERKIFVGGLPPLDSGSLGKIFEEHFGVVEDAVVFECQSDSPVEPYGFGVVTFKEGKSVLAALQALSVIIKGKIIEIKSSVPRVLLLKEFQKLAAPEQEELGMNQEQNSQESPAETSFGNNVKDGKLGHTSWVDKLLNSEALACSVKPRAPPSSSSVDIRIPAWFRTFQKWLPSFLQDASNRLDGKYPLSSLKADFRAACGLELDHISLGYSKLGNFIKSLPDLCHVKTLPLGKFGSPSHMVLLPNFQESPELIAGPHALFRSTSLDSNHNNVDAIGHKNSQDEDDKLIYLDDNADGSKDSQDQDDLLIHCDDSYLVQDEAKKGSPCHEDPKQTADWSFTVNPRFLQFLKPDPIFYALSSQQCDGTSGNPDDGRLEEGTEGKTLGHQVRHVVLEALASKQCNKSVFFLRQFDFYKNYSSSIAEGMCFACGQHEMLFANFPCKHLLWCSYCDMQFEWIADTFERKCVVCDTKVQKTDLFKGNNQRHQITDDQNNNLELPPLYLDNFGIKSMDSGSSKSKWCIGSRRLI